MRVVFFDLKSIGLYANIVDAGSSLDNCLCLNYEFGFCRITQRKCLNMYVHIYCIGRQRVNVSDARCFRPSGLFRHIPGPKSSFLFCIFFFFVSNKNVDRIDHVFLSLSVRFTVVLYIYIF